MKNPVKFFGRELVNNGSFLSLQMGTGVTVVLWQALARPKRLKTGLEPARWMWHAKIVGAKPNNDFIVVRGRSPAEALRKLEGATLKALRQFVKVFAVAFRQIGSELLRLAHTELPQVKKK